MVDDDLIYEVKNLKKLLRNYFKDMELRVCFLEISNIEDPSSHAFLDAITYPKGLEDEITLYFKKSLSEDMSDWSENRKIVDTKKY